MLTLIDRSSWKKGDTISFTNYSTLLWQFSSYFSSCAFFKLLILFFPIHEQKVDQISTHTFRKEPDQTIPRTKQVSWKPSEGKCNFPPTQSTRTVCSRKKFFEKSTCMPILNIFEENSISFLIIILRKKARFRNGSLF